jgi:sodium/bile acid cotransporter 7
MLPSTVQSSIALVAVARGNVAAAVCSASASNLIGIFVTPAAGGRC